MKTERLGITMLINDNSQLKRNVEQIGFQLALKTSKSLSWSDILRQTVPYCPTGNREGLVSKLSSNNLSLYRGSTSDWTELVLSANSLTSRPVSVIPVTVSNFFLIFPFAICQIHASIEYLVLKIDWMKYLRYSVTITITVTGCFSVTTKVES